MKKLITTLASILVVGVLSAVFVTKCTQPSEKPVEHIIMLSPWLAFPPSKDAEPPISRAKAKEMILDWAKPLSPKILGSDPMTFKLLEGSRREIDIKAAGAIVFSALLTPTAAELLQAKLPFFVTPRQGIAPSPITRTTFEDIGEMPIKAQKVGGDDPKHQLHPMMDTPKALWATNSAVTNAASGNPISRPFVRSPVLYVLDTGVQPYVKTAANTYDWHPQLKEPILAGRLRIRQGRVPDSLLAVWPPNPAQNTVWESTPVDQLIPLSTQYLPIPPLASGDNVHPYLVDWPEQQASLDDMHGTQVAIAALGSCAPGANSKNAGIMGRFTVSGDAQHAVELESIRIYPGGAAPAANFDALKGVFQAIDAHLMRGEGAASVLLLASRTTSGFDQTLEAALWWAWKHGIVCVVAAGNTPTSTASAASPSSKWYSAPGTIPPPVTTSPSRFDWDIPNKYPDRQAWWPGWNYPQTPPNNPYPNVPYLIEVGASNATMANPGYGNWGTWAGSGSYRGRDVDILAPGVGVACAMTNYASDPDFLMLGNGTSLSTGYVAGAALVYVASAPPPPSGMSWSTQFRSWLFPPPANAVPANTAPCAIMTSPPAGASPTAASPHSATSIPPPYKGKVPKLRITNETNW